MNTIKISYLIGLILLSAPDVWSKELPYDVMQVSKRRSDAIAQINQKYVTELERLKVKYTKAGDLESANAIVTLIKEIPAKKENSMVGDFDFDGTSWAFHTDSKKLDELQLLKGGRIKSQQYPDSTWERIDNNSIKFSYNKDPNGGQLIFQFQDASRTKMSALQTALGTRRYLYKISK